MPDSPAGHVKIGRHGVMWTDKVARRRTGRHIHQGPRMPAIIQTRTHMKVTGRDRNE